MRENMKTNLKMFAMLFASLLIGLTACDKKQDDLNNGEATGDYGYMSLSLQLPNAGSLLGVDDTSIPQAVEICCGCRVLNAYFFLHPDFLADQNLYL